MGLTLAFMVVTSSTLSSCTGSDAVNVNDEAGKISISGAVEASVTRFVHASIADRPLNFGLCQHVTTL